MSKIRATNNHANQCIPQEETVSGWRIGIIITGVSITLPAFLVGAEVISALGALHGIIAIFLAGIILMFVAILVMGVSAQSRLSTYALIQFPFGHYGAKCVNLLLTVTLFGWYGVTVMLFGQACQHVVQELFSVDLPLSVYIILGSGLVVVTTLFGFQAIDRLAQWSVPLMFLVLLSCVYSVLTQYSLEHIFFIEIDESQTSIKSIGMGISIIVGAFMIGVTISSDIGRFSRSAKDGVFGALLSYGSCASLVLIMAGIPGLLTGEKDLLKTLYEFGLGLPALFIVIFATLTTNVNNLYSASLGLAQIAPKIKDWVITFSIGSIGATLALLGIMDQFINFLMLLSIAIPPIAGIFITDFFLIQKRKYHLAKLDSGAAVKSKAFIAWIVAIIFATLSSKQIISFTSIAALDSLLAAATFYWLLHVKFSKEKEVLV